MAENETESALSVLKTQAANLSADLAKVTSERDRLKDTHATQFEELKTLRAAATEAAGHATRVTELEGQLRSIKHKDAFVARAKELGAREEAIDDLFTLSGYKAETDVIDPAAIETVLTAAKQARGYAFHPEEGEAVTTEKSPNSPDVLTLTPVRTVPGSGRGSTAPTAQQGATITASQMADPKFALDPRNKARIMEAAQNRRFRGYPDREMVGG